LPVDSVCELGAQQLYGNSNYGKFADVFYKAIGVKKYDCIDLNRWNDAMDYDLSELLPDTLQQYDMVTDFGTSEHVTKLDVCWQNKVKLCKRGGLIISENPKVGSWADHGFHYMTIEKVKEIGAKLNLTLIDIGETAAMGNYTDGWNIWSVFRK